VFLFRNENNQAIFGFFADMTSLCMRRHFFWGVFFLGNADSNVFASGECSEDAKGHNKPTQKKTSSENPVPVGDWR